MQLCFVNVGYHLFTASSIAEKNENQTQVDMPVFAFKKKISDPDRVLTRIHLIKQLQTSAITSNHLEINPDMLALVIS